MSQAGYRTSPLPSPNMPSGIPYIVGNEAAERFSFYGMRSILVIYMTTILRNRAGETAPMSEVEAKYYFHLFEAGAYLFPILGGLLADVLWGKYRTIILLSLVYCLGHVALAADETRLGLAVGLSLIAVGAGGIKPCVSAHVGDQFGRQNQHLVSRVFGWFYFAINLGAFASTILTPILLKHVGPAVAFGVPGVLMFLATLIFWLGRHEFVHIPAGGPQAITEAFSPEGRRAIFNLVPLYLFVAVFWSLYDQSASAWVLQAQKMDRVWLGHDWLSSQIQAINPILILTFVPLFSYVVYPAIGKIFPLTPLRKVGIGLFLTVAAFSLSALIETEIHARQAVELPPPNISKQLVAYLVLTAAEVLVSITCLEFSYTQAPKRMKSFIMSLYLLSVSAGNLLTAMVNKFMMRNDGSSRLEGAAYYWFFTVLMLVAAVIFVGFATRYRGQTYIQDEGDGVASTT